jgi:predicted lipoprotein with Yx(FWY)xxD motif
MRHPRIIIAGIGLAAVAAAGGVTAASAGGSPASSPPAASSAPAAPGAATATVRTTPAAVAGKTEAILVTARGLPLYFYRPDTATKSFVTGGLAQLWPPLTSAAPTAAGLSGKLTVLNDAHGHQVAYNGHLLYTFTSDHPGQVTGQGFQNFFVATPGLAPPAGAAAGAVPAAPPGGGLGY